MNRSRNYLFVFIFIITFVIIYASLKLSNGSGNTIPNDEQKHGKYIPRDFVNCIFNSQYDPKYPDLWLDRYLPYFRDSLGFNAVLAYPSETSEYGTFWDPLSNDQIKRNLELLRKANRYGLKFLRETFKFSLQCNSQRIKYEVPVKNGDSRTNYGFCFSYVRDNSFVSNKEGYSTFSLRKSGHKPGIICKNIFENLQHTDYVNRQHDKYDWYLKPRMKINISDFNPASDIPVVKIYTKGFDGSIIDTMIIKVRNFRDNNNSYNGGFIENFNFTGETAGTDNVIKGDETGFAKGKGNTEWWKFREKCKVDFEIHWPGQVDVDIDYLAVDDIYGSGLFKGEFDKEIYEEIEKIALVDRDLIYTYFMDEVAVSNIEPVKYVMNILNTRGIPLMFAVSSFNNIKSMRNGNLAFRPYFEVLKPERISVDVHEFSGWGDRGNFIPVKALGSDRIDSRISERWKTDILNYTKYIQDTVLGDRNSVLGKEQGSFINQITNFVRQAKEFSPETRLYIQPQIHGWLVKEGNTFVSGLREPLNEEIEAQAMIALAHGAEGLFWFIMQTTVDKIEGYYAFGLTSEDTQGPRRVNHYGQNKWDFVSKMNFKLLLWKPYLDRIIWNSGFSVHSEGDRHSYIKGIKSKIINPVEGQNSCIDKDNITEIDCPYEKFWEIGFFDIDSNNPLNESIREDKFFLIVNRRTTPVNERVKTGDTRILEIMFDKNILNGYSKWKLENVTNGKYLIIDLSEEKFSELGSEKGSLGFFNPGEGKLFRLSPF